MTNVTNTRFVEDLGMDVLISFCDSASPDLDDYSPHGGTASLMWVPVESIGDAVAVVREFIKEHAVSNTDWLGGQVRAGAAMLGKVGYQGEWQPSALLSLARPETLQESLPAAEASEQPSCEVLADIARLAGHYQYVPKDSRDFASDCEAWAVEFEQAWRSNIASGAWEDDEYITRIDGFAYAKLAEVQHDCAVGLENPGPSRQALQSRHCLEERSTAQNTFPAP